MHLLVKWSVKLNSQGNSPKAFKYLNKILKIETMMTNTIVPIFIPMNNQPDKCPKCNKDEEIKEVCAHCGYEYPEKKSSTILAIILLLFAIGTLILFLMFIDWGLFNSRYFNQIRFDKECNYQVPKNWAILTNGKNYIIQKMDDSLHGCIEGSFEIDIYPAEICAPSIFIDSCTAKGCIKWYIETKMAKEYR
jgi:hypothetical protein